MLSSDEAKIFANERKCERKNKIEGMERTGETVQMEMVQGRIVLW